MSSTTFTGATVQSIVSSVIVTNESPAKIVEHVDATTIPVQPVLAEAARVVVEAAALVAIARTSVDRAVEFTQSRPRPRPVPGVETATGDPFSQTLLGQGWVAVQGATALLRTAAREIDEAESAASVDEVLAEFVLSRALSAFEVAARTAVEQGSRVWEVVGTSGNARALGFGETWHVARVLSTRRPRVARRTAISHGYLGWVETYRSGRAG